jgi:hypothetical protein
MLLPGEDTESKSFASTPETSSFSGPLFVSACVVLPVVWGIVVHLVFTWLRKKYRSDQRGAPAWPDYQI